MTNKETFINILEHELEVHAGKVYIPINAQIVQQVIQALKEEPVKAKTTTRRTKKSV